MNKKFYYFIFLALLITITDVKAEQLGEINFNRGWKFMLGDIKGAERIDFIDKDWETVGLPHSFSIPYFMSKDFYVGYGWYRKHIYLADINPSDRYFLEFDGVFQCATIYVNGKAFTTHIGGYTGFSVDITSAIKREDNVVAVRVDNLWSPTTAPRAGEHTFGGGIYRNVRLVKKASAYIDWCGTTISTPELEASAGLLSKVAVTTQITNEGLHRDTFKVVIDVIDAQGNIASSTDSLCVINSKSTLMLSQQTPVINKPHLWSFTIPYLYRLRTRLYRDKALVDERTEHFGFRWINWTEDRGFFLNGQHVVICGANVHQDQAGWGDAVTESGAIRDIAMMKAAGFNFIRGSHYPHSPQFLSACDSLGMMYWSENAFWGIGGFGSDGYWNASAYPINDADTLAFEQNLTQQLEEMVKIHRNHPSIIAWSMCNEPFFSRAEDMPKVARLLKRLVAKCHQLDPTRPVAIGGAQRPLGAYRIDHIGDIAGYNGDGATVPSFQNPGVANIVAEYGSVTSDRPGDYGPGWGDLQKSDGWKGYPWRCGQSIWCGFDHGSIAGSALGKMGIVDYFRIPKRSWYWYRYTLTGVHPPVWPTIGKASAVRIEASKTTNILTDGTDDVQLLIKVIDRQGHELSNSPSVQLRVISGPGYFPTGKRITFSPQSDIRIQDGKAAISFRSYFAGTTLIEAASAGLTRDTVMLHFVGSEEFVPGISKEANDHPYIRYTLLSNGIQVFGYNNPAFASSSCKGHSADRATNDDDQQYWEPSADDRQPIFILDTEKRLALKKIHLKFKYMNHGLTKVETSLDRNQWHRVDIGKKNDKGCLKMDINNKTLKDARFVRLSFSYNHRNKPTLVSIRVRGTVLQ